MTIWMSVVLAAIIVYATIRLVKALVELKVAHNTQHIVYAAKIVFVLL